MIKHRIFQNRSFRLKITPIKNRRLDLNPIYGRKKTPTNLERHWTPHIEVNRQYLNLEQRYSQKVADKK